MTPPVLDGLPTPAHAGCTRAGDATEFAQALIALLQTGLSNEERASIRRAVASLRWEVQLEPFLDILERSGKQAVP